MQQENETNHVEDVEAETFHDHDQDFMTMMHFTSPPSSCHRRHFQMAHSYTLFSQDEM